MSRRLGAPVRLAAGLVALALGLTWFLARPAPGPGRDQLIAEARREAQAGRFEEARRLLLALPDRDLGDDEVANLLGACEHACGHFEAALASWARVGPDSSEWPTIALARARTQAGDLGRFADAEATLEAAIDRAGPLRLEVAHTLLRLYHYEGRADAMVRLIRRTRAQWVNPASELRDLWMVEHSRVDVGEIRQALDAAGARSPGDDRVLLGQAALAIREHRLDEAVGPLDDCLRRRPDDPAVRLTRLRLARDSGDVEGVEAELARLPASAMTEPDLLDLAAWVAAQHGESRTAQLALERRITLRPTDPTTLARLAGIDLRAGRHDRAAELLAWKAKSDAARERYRQLVEDRIPTQGFEELAELAETMGLPFEALAWCSLARRARPTDPTLLATFGRLRSAQDAAEAPASGTLAAYMARLIAAMPPKD